MSKDKSDINTDAVCTQGKSPEFDLYIAKNLLLPGDVVLTRSSAKESSFIAVPTAGPFSHAALVINASHTFESRTVGVGFKTLVTNRAEINDEGHMVQLSRLQDIEAAVVLRHPALASLVPDSNELSTRLHEIVKPLLGLQYPEFVQLAKAVSQRKDVQWISRIFLRAVDFWKKNRKVNPGPFCSQLIALVYEAVGLPLFTKHIPPENVNPNMLLSSVLKPMQGIVRYPDFSKKNDDAFVKKLWNEVTQFDAFSSDQALESMVRTAAFLKAVKPLVENSARELDELKRIIETRKTRL